MTTLPSKTTLTGASTTEGEFRTGLDDLIDYLTENLTAVGGGVIQITNQTGASSVPLTAKGISGQTANIFRVRNSADDDLLAVAADGKTLIGTTNTSHLLNVGGKVQSRAAAPAFELHDGVNDARLEIESSELRLEAPSGSTLRISGPAGANLAGATIRIGGVDEEVLTTASSGFVTASSTTTFSNKTINLTDNTLSGTIAQFNTALSDGDFATLAGTETLTGKTISLGSNTLSGTIAQFNTALSDGDFATLAGSETLSNKTLSSPALTGTPTAPTAAVDTNTTQIATTAFVRAQIADDYTAADVLAKLLTVDGDGSGLSADLVGAIEHERVMKEVNGALHTNYTDWDDAIDVGMHVVVNWTSLIPTNGPTGAYVYGVLAVFRSRPAGAGADYIFQQYITQGSAPSNRGIWQRASVDAGATWGPWIRFLSDNYMGSGSGIDADLLDGVHASALAALAGAAFTGDVSVAGLFTASDEVRSGIQTLTSSTAISVVMTGKNVQFVTLDHNTTFTISGEAAGQWLTLIIKQGTTGGTGAFSGIDVWMNGGAAPTLSTETGKIDIVSLFVLPDGTVVGSHMGP